MPCDERDWLSFPFVPPVCTAAERGRLIDEEENVGEREEESVLFLREYYDRSHRNGNRFGEVHAG